MGKRLAALVLLTGCASVARPLAAPRSTTAVPTSAATEATTSTTAPRARPFPIASLHLDLVSPSGGPLGTTVWYPVGTARAPLVVFAHGFGVGPAPYTRLCQAWAAAGYVVAVPTFPARSESYLQNEPADVGAVITAVLARGLADPDHVAVAGHSDGGEAVLAVGFDRAFLDPRVRVVIAMSVQPLPDMPVLPYGSRPLLVVQGDADTINPVSRGLAAYAQASRPRALLLLRGAGHLPPFDGTTAWQPVVELVTTDFLDRYLAGAASGDAVLLTDGNRPGLSTLTLDSAEKS